MKATWLPMAMARKASRILGSQRALIPCREWRFPRDMQEMVEAWSDPEFLGEFMTVERLPDQSVADQQAAVFQTNFNLRSLMDSAEFHELLGDDR